MEGIVDQLDMVARKSEPSLEAELRTLIKDTDVVSLCTQHMKRLIDDVLSLSKLDSELLQISDVACRPLSFTREVLSMFEPELQSKAITYSLEVCDGYRQLVPDGVKVDPQRVTQVVSLSGTQSGSNVNISSEPLGSDYLYLIWSVQDTGPGLSEEESGRLFQRFQQAQPKTHVTYGGSGLVRHFRTFIAAE
ncbi:hypothetical protein QFC19_000731 [Naganishia cerealis]|uniref:Uncharacterized protein n=1 Tax=Naganishia cerealis TaxID=610337 RepID=A0ACC2WL00_9TREE|nr:hypothetical protein QFC19_000731 [Naganishia cerealis]